MHYLEVRQPKDASAAEDLWKMAAHFYFFSFGKYLWRIRTSWAIRVTSRLKRSKKGKREVEAEDGTKGQPGELVLLRETEEKGPPSNLVLLV